ncbi:hypothetical protein [Planktothrix paucivesiculata]|uniref:Uncharacterized protein n=1 Tax=Planktothrix paucivesiculata PCC 9631 TaxID=671071 RepID=A0A7Z9DUC3_9CYAN|nr:hypothetical protein [Planktothrix paucivesiculata]VXD10670.1 hypothetical protein PL9631_1000017 [Planktothrix paucivesiculata PCC 9631]
MSELNGQWLDCSGKPCFCPDNSPSPYDYLWDELESESKSEPNYNPQSKSQTEIAYDEF